MTHIDKYNDNIPGWPGYYISKHGHLYTSKYVKDRWYRVRGHIHKGRLQVKLKDHGRSKQGGISRLVALAWVPNPKPEEYNVVMHLDNNPLNNYYKNLKWGTMAMNNEQCRLEGRSPVACSGDININRKVSLKQEAEIMVRFRKGRKALIDSLASEYNLSIGGIKKILSKHNITYGT